MRTQRLFEPTTSTQLVEAILIDAHDYTETQAATAVAGLVDADVEPGTEGTVADRIAVSA